MEPALLGSASGAVALALAFVPKKGRKGCRARSARAVVRLRLPPQAAAHRLAQAEALTALAARCRVCGLCARPPI